MFGGIGPKLEHWLDQRCRNDRRGSFRGSAFFSRLCSCFLSGWFFSGRFTLSSRLCSCFLSGWFALCHWFLNRFLSSWFLLSGYFLLSSWFLLSGYFLLSSWFLLSGYFFLSSWFLFGYGLAGRWFLGGDLLGCWFA